jgi:hypothetical protein
MKVHIFEISCTNFQVPLVGRLLPDGKHFYGTIFDCQDSSVAIATGYNLEVQGSMPGKGKKFFSTLQHPDRLCGPLTFLSKGYWGLFPKGETGRSVKLTTHLHLVPRSRLVELYFHSPIRLHGVAFS